MPFQSPFNAIRNQFRPPQITITEGQSVDATSGVLAIGQFGFNAANYPFGTEFRFRSTLSVSGGALTGTVLLYNLTDGEVVSATTLSTSSTTPDSQVGLDIPVGVIAGNLKPSAKTYEVRLSVTGALPTDIVNLGSAALVII
jgi:hypothetical protein